MGTEDLALERAVVAAINAARGAKGWSIATLAREMDRPYDSTRNYLKNERSMPLEFLLVAAQALGVPDDELVREAREKHLQAHP